MIRLSNREEANPVKYVLIIDDSKGIIDAFHIAFEHKDEEIRRPIMLAIWNETGEYNVTFARSIEEGKEKLTQRKWDLVLLDGRIPNEEKTGVQILEFLMQNKQYLPKEIQTCTGDFGLQIEMENLISKLYGTQNE